MGRRRKGESPDSAGAVRRLFSDDELELLRAVDRFRREHGRPPSLVEGFRLLKALGWEKAEETTP